MMLTQLFDSLRGVIAGLTTDQYVAILVAVLALSCAGKVIKEGLSILLTVVGLLAILYFFAPDLYYRLFEFLGHLLHSVG